MQRQKIGKRTGEENMTGQEQWTVRAAKSYQELARVFSGYVTDRQVCDCGEEEPAAGDCASCRKLARVKQSAYHQMMEGKEALVYQLQETARYFMEMEEASFDRVLGINLKGTFFLCQQAANAMVKAKENGPEDYAPRIVNIGSISAYTSSTARGEYCMSKAGVAMVTQLFADRLAEYGIPVFEVRPGIIATDMTKTVHEKYQNLIDGGLLPVKRFGKPEDVAKMVLACCSGLLDYTAGQILNADGGFHLRRL